MATPEHLRTLEAVGRPATFATEREPAWKEVVRAEVARHGLPAYRKRLLLGPDRLPDARSLGRPMTVACVPAARKLFLPGY